jgi:hypothetical protein
LKIRATAQRNANQFEINLYSSLASVLSVSGLAGVAALALACFLGVAVLASAREHSLTQIEFFKRPANKSFM